LLYFLQVTASRETLLRGYAVGLATAAVLLATTLFAVGYRLGSATAVTTLVIVALLAERQSIGLTPRGPNGEAMEVSIASLVFIFAGVTFGPLAAMIVGAAGLMVDFGRPYTRWTVWTGSRAITAGAAGLVAVAFGATSTHSFGVLLVATGAAAVTEVIFDLAFNSVTHVIRGTGAIGDLARASGPLLIASVPLHTPFIAVLAYAYREVSPWSVALFVMPAFAAQRLFLMYREQRQTAEELGIANGRLERANISFATALVTTLDARDRYTAGHSAAVAIYSRDIAIRMGMPEERQNLAHLCGLVHDIGKIGLPAGLLEKPGALTLEERRQMETHPAIGERILSKVEDYDEIASIVRHHHERVDGNGYPDGLEGDAVPPLSRVIAVADAYNAMTSDRPYREAMPSRVARLRLAQAVETQFDTSVVAAFEAILAGAPEEYRVAKSADFALEMRAHEQERELALVPATGFALAQ
jgi:putative nucleotidyltransferase with HDIG domain